MSVKTQNENEADRLAEPSDVDRKTLPELGSSAFESGSLANVGQSHSFRPKRSWQGTDHVSATKQATGTKSALAIHLTSGCRCGSCDDCPIRVPWIAKEAREADWTDKCETCTRGWCVDLDLQQSDIDKTDITATCTRSVDMTEEESIYEYQPRPRPVLTDPKPILKRTYSVGDIGMAVGSPTTRSMFDEFDHIDITSTKSQATRPSTTAPLSARGSPTTSRKANSKIGANPSVDSSTSLPASPSSPPSSRQRLFSFGSKRKS